MTMPSIYLIKGREKSLLRRHPWIFSRGIERIEGEPKLGETIDVYSHAGQWLAKAAFSPQSQIRARVWSFSKQEINLAYFIKQLQNAQKLREPLMVRDGLSAYRLIAGESDGLPGVTIDRYQDIHTQKDFFVCQLLSAGAEYHRQLIIDALLTIFPQANIYERSDVAVRKKEGLSTAQGVLHGETPPALITIKEHGIKIQVDIMQGHKTGFYLDQRDSRFAAIKYMRNKQILNCFSYTGTFGLYALKAGAASVTNVDVSQPALDLAASNVEINDFDFTQAKFINADVFELLRQYKNQGKTFDVIIMDPPKFAESKAQLKGACRGYKDINRLAMHLLNPGGILLSYSCSGLMDGQLFQKILADAALDAGKRMQFIERFAQAADHPVDSAYPEGFYLKGFACQICD